MSRDESSFVIEICSAVSDVTLQLNAHTLTYIKSGAAMTAERGCLGPKCHRPTLFGPDLSRGRGGSGAEVSGNR